MADTDVLSIRMPTVLKARIRAEANKQGVKLAEFVAEACRMRLDGGSSKRPAPEPVMGQTAQKDASYGAGDASAASITAMGDSQPRPTMQALRDICAGKPSTTSSATLDVEKAEIPICGKDWWEDGEQYECLMDKGHREALAGKHGLRGMVRRLDA